MVSVFPNPSNNVVNLTATNDGGEESSFGLQIISIYGKKEYEVDHRFSGKLSKQIDVSKLSSGQYIIRIMIGNVVINKVLMIVR
jgi:hypothetical protein